jgi:drug/metabolite transporter (DMT)-like permease
MWRQTDGLRSVSPAEVARGRTPDSRCRAAHACAIRGSGAGSRVGRSGGTYTAWAVSSGSLGCPAARVVGAAAIADPLVVTGRRRMSRAALPLVVVCGLCEVLGFASFALGARHGLAVSAVLASQFAAIAAVVAYLAFHEQLARVQVIGVTTIAVGVSVLSALNG